MGRPDMGLENERYATDAARVEHEAEITDVSVAWTSPALLLYCLCTAPLRCAVRLVLALHLAPASCDSGAWRWPSRPAFLASPPPSAPSAPQVIEAWVAARPSAEVMRVLNEARVPAGPILSTADIAAEPQYLARGMIQRAAPPSGERAVQGRRPLSAAPRWAAARMPALSTSSHPAPPWPAAPSTALAVAAGGDEVSMPAMLPVMHGTPGGTRWAGPELGEHTEQILRQELGLGDADIARLREAGAI